MHDPVRKRDFTKGALTADGYSGWTTFGALRPKRGTLEIPSIGGTYIVVRVTDAPPRFGAPPPDMMVKPPTLIPRCDDSVMRARGDCVDHSAGLKLVPRGEELPQNLAAAAETSPRDLLFMQQEQTAVIASAAPLTGPVIYEFRLAHK